jgi:hypothetical protein
MPKANPPADEASPPADEASPQANEAIPIGPYTFSNFSLFSNVFLSAARVLPSKPAIKKNFF